MLVALAWDDCGTAGATAAGIADEMAGAEGAAGAAVADTAAAGVDCPAAVVAGAATDPVDAKELAVEPSGGVVVVPAAPPKDPPEPVAVVGFGPKMLARMTMTTNPTIGHRSN